MAKKSNWYIIKLIISLLLFAGLSNILLSQTTINGIINKYGNVTELGTDYVIVSNNAQYAQFVVNDTVLLIQMKGARIEGKEVLNYGEVTNYVGRPGKHEFLIIQSLEPGNKIVFRNNILTAFNVNGVLQIIKVPSFNAAVVDNSDLTCMKWDSTSKTGGVLAIIVGKTLTLNKNIDVTGKGFAGGAIAVGTGLCVMSDETTLNKYAYDASYTNSGFKGEGPVSTVDLSSGVFPSVYPVYAKGMGRNLTGGGGGNGKFSGGGGGSNYGGGGSGGQETPDCDGQDGGRGGFELKANQFEVTLSPILLGGGGGSSTSLYSTTASPGGNGGGIVIIICETLDGNGNSIIANGASAATAGVDQGSGGGGGGGSVAIYLQNFSSSALTVRANGGKGGDNPGSFGEGGGGGGGYITISKDAADIPVNVTREVFGGTVGQRTGVETGLSGSPGKSAYGFVPYLNGFLFNSVRSSVTGNQIDSICSDMTPKMLTGTTPVGGSGTYTYSWQKSYDLTGPETNIASSNVSNYSFSVPESDTVWLRRIVKDDVTLLTDTSKWIEIKVQPFIENNDIGNPDTICYKGDPPLIQQLLPDLKVPTTKYFLYEWQDSTEGNTWGSPVATSKNYNPPAGLTKTTWFRRKVTSGRCVDSTAFVRVTVLDTISKNNILNSAEEICWGMTFTDLSATVAPILEGGDNSYRYRWESSINDAEWGPAPGVNNASGYNPTELAEKAPLNKYYFRRVVLSGMHDVCANTSAPVLLKDFPVITNNSISADQTIGHDSVPAPFAGLAPANGNGTYGFLWQSRTKTVSWGLAGGTNNSQNYSSAALTDTTWYRRVVNSSACSDTSNIIVIRVHKTITNNIIAFASGAVEDTICNGATPGVLKGTTPLGGSDQINDYAFKWFSSPDNITWSAIITGGTLIDYAPGPLTATTYFRREVSSPKTVRTSVSKSDPVKITVLPLISNIVSGSDIICYGTTPGSLLSTSLSGGDGSYKYIWQDSSTVTGWKTISGGDAVTYQPPNLTVPTKFKRIVLSGNNNCCIDTSNVLAIGIHPLPTAVLTTVSDTICEGAQVPLKITLTGAAPWKVIYQENATQSSENNVTTSTSTLNANPVTTTDHTKFTYKLTFVTDYNGCIATSLTGTRIADVYKWPVAYAGADAVICGTEITLTATPSSGTGTWTYPSDVVSATIINPYTLKVNINPVFPDGNVSHTFYWEETNWRNCKSKDDILIKFYKEISSINAGKDTTLFSFDNAIQMSASPVEDWETASWSIVSGSGDPDDPTANNTYIKNLAQGTNTFLWKVANGECNREDEVNVDVYSITIPQGFSPNNDGVNDIFIILGLDVQNQMAELKIVNGAGTEVFSTSNINQDWTYWDGKNSKGADLPEGTYYYMLKLTSTIVDGAVFKKSGFIVLKRY